MSYRNPSPGQSSRLSTPVRLGVAAVAACFIAAPVFSNPVNPTVVNGTASFNQAGNVLTVTNSNGAIINWDKFSIQHGETTHFAQAAASSSVMNRVLNDPTAIYGTLSSNGRVFLVNPAGIMVGPGGRVDTAGFVASTLAIRNEDFLAGRNLFINDGAAGDVINRGEIKTPAGGSVYLIGTNVSNEGIITTSQGETILAAGATVSLIDSATPGVKVDITGAEGNATNLGTITAEAGRIGIAGVIVRNSGQLNASSVVSEGGRIFLKASQDAYVDGNGRIVTTGTKGGSVEVLGNRVAVMDNAEIDASGTNGGGRIMVGGDYQGKNPDIQNASVSYFGSDARLKADATEVGDGGTVIVWADDTTRAYGNISARGGANGGNGGFVEVSGKHYLAYRAYTDLRAPGGNAGSLLLDPDSITIVQNDVYGGDESLSGNVLTSVSPGTLPATIGWNTIQAALDSGNLSITSTNGDIYVNASPGMANIPISHVDSQGTWSNTWYGAGFSSSNSLSLLANQGVNINAVFGNAGSGAINIMAGWNSASGTLTPVLVSTYTAGQNININSGGGIVSKGAVTLNAANTVNVNGGSFNSGIDMDTGALSIVANSIVLTAGATGYSQARISSNGSQSFTLGRDTVYGSAGGLFLTGGNGTGVYGGQAMIEKFGSSGGQAFDFLNGSKLQLQAGSGDGYVPPGQWSGDCSGGGCSGNSVSIRNFGDAGQTFTFSGTGGSMTLYGGLAGAGNYANINSHAGNQIINGNADIVLIGGSGGSMDHENSADITLGGGNTTGVQTVNANNITINGGGSSSSYGGAGFGTENGRNQTFNVAGDLAMTGGGSSSWDFRATPAYIGSEYGGGTINLFVNGNIDLNGGSGLAGGVLIGSLGNLGGATNVNVLAVNDITTAANTGGVWLGVKNPTGPSGSNVLMIAGWDPSTTAAPATTGTTGSVTGTGELNAGAVALTVRAADSISLGDVIANGSEGAAGSNVDMKAVNGTLTFNSVSAQGGAASGNGAAGGAGGKIALWAKNLLTAGVGGINASGGRGGDGGEGGLPGGTGGRGGEVKITSQAGNIAVYGGIVSNGGDGGEGGWGDYASGYGVVHGFNGGQGGTGGQGGSIILDAKAGSIAIIGAELDANGGNGGSGGGGGGAYAYELDTNAVAYGGLGGRGGTGGEGGSIRLETAGNYTSIQLDNAILQANGGSGGDTGDSGYGDGNSEGYPAYGYGGAGGLGGTGGQGGSITLAGGGTGGISMINGSQLWARGGIGGWGGDGGTGYGSQDDTSFSGSGGAGGAGGNAAATAISLTSAGNISIYGGVIDAGGGDSGEGGWGGGYEDGNGGNGGAGGDGGNGGGILLKATGIGGSITLDGATQLHAKGGDGGDGGEGGYSYASYGGDGGQGGAGGTGGGIELRADAGSGSISLVTGAQLDAGGGYGGYGGYGGSGESGDGVGGVGGAGGSGGRVNVFGGDILGDGSAFFAVSGGMGGAGRDAVPTVGTGGNGGHVGLNTTGDVFLDDFQVAVNGGTGAAEGRGGDILVAFDGALSYSAPSMLTALSSSSSIQLATGNVLTIATALSTLGTLQLTSGTGLVINSTLGGYNVELGAPIIDINAPVTASNNAALGGATINLYAGVTAGGSSATKSSIVIDGIAYPYSGVAFAAKDFKASGGSAFLMATHSTSDVSGLVTGNITLDNGAYFRAGHDVDLTLRGSESTLSLSKGGYVLANAPTTISLAFTSRSSGGVMIDGLETIKPGPSGSGLYVGSYGNAATPGAGLSLAYASNVVVDPCVINPTLCKVADKPPTESDVPLPPDTSKPDSTKPPEDLSKTTGGTEGTFGGDESSGDNGNGKDEKKDDEKDKKSDEAKDEKKDEKPAQKKVAQCS